MAQDYQYEFNGLVMGRGTRIKVLKVEGLFQSPDIVTSDTQRQDGDGEYSSDDETFTGRVLDFELALLPGGVTPVDALYEELQAATSNIKDYFPLKIKRPGRPERQIDCKFRRRSFSSDGSFARGLGKGALQLKALDPLIYSSQLHQSDPFGESNPGLVEGRAYPRVYPLAYRTSATPSNVAVIRNAGTYPAPAMIRLFGPMPQPVLENLTTGNHLDFNTTLAAGEFYEINLDDSSILLNGQANKDRALNRATSSWFKLVPGNNSLRLRSSGTEYAGQFTVQWRDAWV